MGRERRNGWGGGGSARICLTANEWFGGEREGGRLLVVRNEKRTVRRCRGGRVLFLYIGPVLRVNVPKDSETVSNFAGVKKTTERT
jgi:hypothetical protein